MLIKSFFPLIWFFATLTFALSLSVSNGYGGPTVLLFLSSVSLFYFKPKWSSLDVSDKCLIYVFLLFGLSMFGFVYLDGWHTRELDRPSRFILVLPVLILLLQSKNHKEWLWYGLIFGAISAFVLAFYEKIILGLERAHGSESAIMFGDISMLLGMMNLAGSAYFLSQKRFFWIYLSLFAALCGICASFLSGSRGGWVALPLVGFFLLWQSRCLLSKKSIISILVCCIFIISAITLVPQTGVKQKIDQTVVSLSQYGSGENKTTSLGLRFEMWKTAFLLFQKAPIFGVGEYGEKAEKMKMIEDGTILPKMLSFHHAHNELINALSQRGIIGLFFLLALYFVPIKLFMKKMKQYEHNWRVKSYAMAGALIPMCYIDFGLSQVMFSHNIGVMMYAFPIVYFWAAVRWAEREEFNMK